MFQAVMRARAVLDQIHLLAQGEVQQYLIPEEKVQSSGGYPNGRS